MKKILFVLVGLLLSVGLYAEKNCQAVKTVTTIGGDDYALAGTLCAEGATSIAGTVTLQDWIIANAGQPRDKGNVKNVGVVFNNKKYLLSGELAAMLIPNEKGPTLGAFLKDILSQLVDGKGGTTSGSFNKLDNR